MASNEASSLELTHSDEARRKERKPIRLLDDQVRKLVLEQFGVVVDEVKELDSYDDRNYLVACPNKRAKVNSVTTSSRHRFVLKVHNGVDSEKSDFIEAQVAAFNRLRNAGVRCPVDVPGGSFRTLKEGDEASKHYVRLLEFVEGTIMYDAMLTCADELERIALLGKVGQMLAKADGALIGLEETHPALRRTHVWDLQRFDDVRVFAMCISEASKTALIEEVFAAFGKIKPTLGSLPRSVIQGDANDRNIVVCEDGEPALLDFGDVVLSYNVGELAIALAYCIVGFYSDCTDESAKMDDLWLQRCSAFAQGYVAQQPMRDAESSVLYELAWARLATSACIGAFSASKDPKNDYLLVHSLPAWRSLRAMQRVGKQAFVERVLNPSA